MSLNVSTYFVCLFAGNCCVIAAPQGAGPEQDSLGQVRADGVPREGCATGAGGHGPGPGLGVSPQPPGMCSWQVAESAVVGRGLPISSHCSSDSFSASFTGFCVFSQIFTSPGLCPNFPPHATLSQSGACSQTPTLSIPKSPRLTHPKGEGSSLLPLCPSACVPT